MTARKRKLLELYSQKYNLSSLGRSGERILLKVTTRTKAGRQLVLFANYVVGRKEAQAVSESLDDSCDVVNVTRYKTENFVVDFNRLAEPEAEVLPRLVLHGTKISIQRESAIPALPAEFYAFGGRAYLELESSGKILKFVVEDGKSSIYDAQRRKLTGLTKNDERLVLQREFQHREPNTS